MSMGSPQETPVSESIWDIRLFNVLVNWLDIVVGPASIVLPASGAMLFAKSN